MRIMINIISNTQYTPSGWKVQQQLLFGCENEYDKALSLRIDEKYYVVVEWHNLIKHGNFHCAHRIFVVLHVIWWAPDFFFFQKSEKIFIFHKKFKASIRAKE